MSPEAAFLALRESHDLASSVARHAQLPITPLDERIFEGGEFRLRPLESVRDRTAFVLQCLAGTAEVSVSERLLKLLFLLHGLRDAGAQSRILLLPYLTFARKDRRTQPRDPVNTRYVAQLLESSGVDRVVALDVHNPAALDNSFRVPVDHLSFLPMLTDHIVKRLPDSRLAVASPDIGGVKRAQLFRELLEARTARPVELAFFEKRRVQGVVSGHALVGEVKERTVIIIDDLCATGNTLMRAAQTAHHAGAAAVYTAVTHVPHIPGLAALLADPNITGCITTDSVGFAPVTPPAEARKLTVLSIVPLFGQAVARMLARKPLAPLLESWPVVGG